MGMTRGARGELKFDQFIVGRSYRIVIRPGGFSGRSSILLLRVGTSVRDVSIFTVVAIVCGLQSWKFQVRK